MSELFASGRIVDLILALMAAQGAALWIHHARTGRGIPPGEFIPHFVAGAALMLALRAALVGEPWTVVGAWLAASLVAHVVELARRWRR
jgi:hypothetical protein